MRTAVKAAALLAIISAPAAAEHSRELIMARTNALETMIVSSIYSATADGNYALATCVHSRYFSSSATIIDSVRRLYKINKKELADAIIHTLLSPCKNQPATDHQADPPPNYNWELPEATNNARELVIAAIHGAAAYAISRKYPEPMIDCVITHGVDPKLFYPIISTMPSDKPADIIPAIHKALKHNCRFTATAQEPSPESIPSLALIEKAAKLRQVYANMHFYCHYYVGGCEEPKTEYLLNQEPVRQQK